MIQSRAFTSETKRNNYRDLLRNATLQIRSLRSEIDAIRQRETEPIAIIGMACRFPGKANTPESYWELLHDGVDTTTQIPPQRWDVVAHYDPDADAPGKMYTQHGSFIDGVDQFDPQFFGISPREACSLDPQQRLLLEVSYTALENAGQPPFDLRSTRTGVFIGVSFDDYSQLSVRSGNLTRIDAFSSLGNIRSIAAGRLSYTFGFQGPTMQLDTTCSSSLLAVHLACQSLRSGESNLALAGGVNLMLSPEPTIGFCKLKALAPDGRCKTFDAAADGYGRGEGCGVIVLKRLSDAIDNQDPILALVRGSAVNHDGLSNGLTAPNGSAQESLLRQALANANAEPDQIQYIEVHGTGTRLGDPIEVLALNEIMGRRSTPLLIGSVKTNIGHLESAAGIASLMKVILALQNRQIPPHLHLKTPNPHIPWDKLAIDVPTQLTPWPPTKESKLAGISSFGMSGTNVHLIVEEAPQRESVWQKAEGGRQKAELDMGDLVWRDRPLHLLTLSARNETALRQLVQRYQDELDGYNQATLPDICFSANVGRSHFNHRLALVAADFPQLRQQLAAFLDRSLSPEVAAHSRAQARRKIAFLFTGQGSQYLNMGRALYKHEPVFRREIDRCAGILAGEGIALLEVLYGETENREQGIGNRSDGVMELGSDGVTPLPHYPITPLPIPPSPHRLNQTIHVQPTLFALEYALAQLWLSWGIEPDGVMGHSIGEYVAACVAGVFSLEDGLRLVAARGRLMQALPSGGGMVAVMASAEQVAALLPEGISIAAVNGPEATVISGDLIGLADEVAVLEAEGFKCQALQVSHAFHSTLMEPMLAEFRAVAKTVGYVQPQIELISNVTGQLTDIANADYWVNHVRQPVQFAAGMNTLAAQSYDTFIEIGPKPVLLGMGRACLPEMEALWLPSLRPNADWQTLLSSLGQLYASGATVDWAGFDRSHPRQMVRLPNYPFQRQRYWIEDKPRNASSLLSPRSEAALDHPLLGRPLSLAENQVRYFEVQLQQNAPVYLRDHQVFGAVVFPAAGYLEMAIAAARSFLPKRPVLQDVALLKSLLLPKSKHFTAPEAEAVPVQTVLTRLSSDDYAFEIFSQAKAVDSCWQCHVKGRIGAETDSPSQIDLGAKQEELAGEMLADTFYESYRQRGIDYGPEFRVVEQIWRGTGEALGHIRLSSAQLTELKNYHFHPIILDAGLQLAGATLNQGSLSTTYLPVGIERLSLFEAGANAPEWVYAQRQDAEKASGQSLSSAILIVDVQFLSAAGRAIATLEGLRLQPASPKLLLGAEFPDESENTWRYQVAWLPQPLPKSVLPSDFLMTPDAIRDLIAPDFTHLVAHPEFATYQALLPQFETLSLSYVIQALEQLGWSPQPGETFTDQELADQLKVTQQHQRLFHRCLQILAEERILQQYGEQWELVQPLPVPEISQIRDRISRYPAASAELTLLSRCGENLAAVLQGNQDPLTVLFPEGDLSRLTRLYEDSPGAQVMNSLVRRAIAAAITEPQRPVRILEIGAGTGGTTAHLLPHLGNNVEYVFTDVSSLFLNKARERFQAYSFVQYKRLNIERSPAEQGFTKPFDLVIAANVLHATADLRQTLAHTSELLAPGGELILLEGHQPLRWLDVIFGLTEGWWRFTDQDVRADYPLLSVSQWRHLLHESGFTSAVLKPDAQVKNHRRLPQSIIIAQRDESSHIHPAAKADWLILADTPDLSRPLKNGLLQRGHSPYVIYSETSDTQQGDLSLDWTASDLIEQLLQILQMGAAWQGIVYLAESSEGEASHRHSIPVVAMETCRRALHLVKGILNANLAHIPRLYFVTQGATELGITEFGLARSPLWGFAKTVALEHPELRCTCIDIEGTDTESLTTELLADSQEQQVAFRRLQRHVARLQPYSAETAEASPLTRLVISEPGTLANLTFQPMRRRSPEADEVEISVAATSLNFRDVLTALGKYPGEPILGCECAGVVAAVGEQVQDLAVGQPVLGIAPGSFSTMVTVNRAMVTPIPGEITIEAAATIPVAFLTAYYSLVQLARLQAGERILIHAATGGVGQAAIQIAQHIGAEIIATASPGKWDALRAIGISHILNSRTLDFADEVMALTQSQGVDVVLNSLAEEFREKSIDVLRKGGRFVELGLGHSPELDGKSYFPVNLAALCQEQPDLIQSMLQGLIEQFKSGVLQPLPQKVFQFPEAAQAFRAMQLAQHVGKLVVIQPQSGWESKKNAESKSSPISPRPRVPASPRPPLSPSPPPSFRSDSTYLITGGTGGLGLQVAEWMVQRGAGHLALVSRHKPTAEVQEQLQVLDSQGATVETIRADVNDVQVLTTVLNNIAASPHPLRGVVHAAGVLSDGQLKQLSWPQFEQVLAPKVQGAWNLHQLTQNLALDHFVLFSSAASLLGSPGQANHAAANAFLDGLAHYRQRQGLPGLSLNWGAWSQVGSALKYQQGDALAWLAGVRLISPEQGLKQLEHLWTQPKAQIGVAPIQWSTFLRQGNLRQSPFLEGFRQLMPSTHSSQLSSAFQQQLAATPKEQQRELLETHVCAQISQILGFAPGELDRRTGFFDLGLDSLTAMELKNRLEASLGYSLPSTLAFDYPTVDRLLDYLYEQLLSQETPGSSSLDTFELATQELSSEADLAAQLDQKLADLEALMD